jgi:hypothetical protein
MTSSDRRRTTAFNEVMKYGRKDRNPQIVIQLVQRLVVSEVTECT